MSYSASDVRILNGKKALSVYQDVMKDKFGSRYILSYNALETRLLTKNPDFYAQVGNALIDSKFGERRLKDSMERVAENSSVSPLGIPDAFGFIKGITDELSSFDVSLFGDAALDIGIDAGKGSVKIVNSIGSAAVGTVENASSILKNSKWIILVVVIFAGAILWRVSKNFKVSDLKPF